MKGVPRWRIAAAAAILAGMVGLLGMFAPYYMRRLAERPANVFFILRNLLRK